jgi:23S rRNA (cytidine1920-2'-O)/16S rRNA (cytidine1409-2'-O)-methyltransferase
LDRFSIHPADRIALDVGASTGGFTDCLLQRGALRVYAVDVGYGQLHWRLRGDPRVVVMERTNARNLPALPDPIEVATIDASFISLRLLLPAVARVSQPEVDIIALVKPQFEAGRGRVGKGGVVRDESVHRDVLMSLAEWLPSAGLGLAGLTASPIRGPAGNVEFLSHIRHGQGMTSSLEAVEAALDEAAKVKEAGSGDG